MKNYSQYKFKLFHAFFQMILVLVHDVQDIIHFPSESFIVEHLN